MMSLKQWLSINRILAVILVIFATVMLTYVIPEQTERVDYGWVSPDTIPSAACILILVLALGQLVVPMRDVVVDLHLVMRACLYVVLGIAVPLLMELSSFLWVAPPLALGIMLAIGERRALWLVLGSVVIPVSLWFVVEILLQRQLP